MKNEDSKTEQPCTIQNVRHSAFFDEVCENDFSEWNKEIKVIEKYPKWEVLADGYSKFNKTCIDNLAKKNIKKYKK